MVELRFRFDWPLIKALLLKTALSVPNGLSISSCCLLFEVLYVLMTAFWRLIIALSFSTI